jgi:uncharacterized protein YjbI with pentapeptide repeats
MKNGHYLLGGLSIGLLLGWVLGYLRLPQIPQNEGFWVGLFSGLTLVSLLALLRKIRPRKSEETSRTGSLLSGAALLLVTGGLLASLLLFLQSRSLQEENRQKTQLLVRDSLLLHRQAQVQQAQLMVDYLAEVRTILAKTSGQPLPETVLARLARFSESFEPYPSLTQAPDSALALSPERGQLLLALLSMEMDSATFSQVKKRVTFAHADLSQTDLSGIDLSQADLRSANFQDANLTSLKCRGCDLRRANLTGAIAREADLSESDLRRAIFQWTDARRALLRNTYLDGADLSHAVLEKADLSESIFQWGEMGGANLAGATAIRVDFLKTGMKQVNFSQANLTESSLRRIELQQCNFQGANLLNVAVNEADWLDRLQAWSVSGSADVQQRYQVIADSVVRYRNSRFVLGERNE